MTMLCNANAIGGGVDTGDIGHSLRFRSAGSTYLSRTFGAPTSTTIWTWSGWVKRGAITGTYRLFGASTNTFLTFNSSDQLNLTLNGVSACTSTAVFRDPTAAIHVVYQQNGASQTIWVNNLSVATGTTAASIFNTAIAHQLGATNTTNFFDGYLSRIAFVDGQALTPSSFGYLNSETTEWTTKSAAAVKSVVDAGGANSFMLEFDDGASLTTLGNDYSSKNNDWTLNNFSLTAGVNYDWMLDVPGNSYCLPSAIHPGITSYPQAALSSGNLSLSGSSRSSFGTMEIPQTGKWAFKFTTPASGTTDAIFGVIASDATTVSASPGVIGAMHSGSKYVNGVTTGGYITVIGTNDTVEVLVDNGAVEIRRNGAANSVAGTMTAGKVYVPLLICGSSSTMTYGVDFGQQGYAPPSGYNALCQRNLPDGEVITTSGTFTGNLNADGPYVDIKGVPLTMTINSNAVTFGTHADKTAFGFKVRSSSASYNNTGSNSFSITSTGPKRKYSLAKGNP